MKARKIAPAKSEPGQDAIEILGRRPSRPQTRDKAAVFSHVVGHFHRVKGDRRIEIGKKDHQDRIGDDITQGADAKPRSTVGAMAGTNWAMVSGKVNTDDAKMTGITPALFTRKGMCVD